VIISRTPIRISFLGGGSDLPAFYRREQGAVLSTTINKYIYITVNAGSDGLVRAAYFAARDGASGTENVEDINSIKHDLIRECLKVTDVRGGIEITSSADVCSLGSGLGSSSAYTVGLLNALHVHKGQMAGAEQLAREACEVEIERCAKPIGKQDQYIAAAGGLQRIHFNGDDTVTCNPLILSPPTRRRLEVGLMLMQMSLARNAPPILEEQLSRARNGTNLENIRRIRDLVAQACEALARDDVDALGELLHCAWMEKKQLANAISNPTIDSYYERARASGAIGGKVLGAGGGGFLLLFANPDRQPEIARSLPELRRMAFRFEPHGSKIIYIDGPAS
jgi:D-glycero-alpha-D-manno-heptose-7-phosphate kinase